METWIWISIAAAFSQNLRFMLQKHLKSTSFSTAGATFSRFIFSAPLVCVLVVIYAKVSGQVLPVIPSNFWPYALAGGLSQILATMCVVALFAERNFAVGITFKKTEVVQTAIVGFLVLGETVTQAGLFAIGIGFWGVILLSDPPKGGTTHWSQRIFNRASGLGLGSGVLFAFSAIGYRGASLSLGVGDVVLSAGTTLALVASFQAIIMAIWLAARERGEISKVLRHWRVAGLVGLTSMIGSFCWFAAFTLQNAAYVKAVGQIELLFSFIAGVVVFKEKTSARELIAMGLISVSILLLIVVI
ncbi:DMT family transporter [Halocynthiibacter namhaensis]|uniref:DMT family transporter n=1 Tax=Halocynthiibacter namhaensis TaxID=1290553 RepID=UPI0005791331|nr:DMT family transporter [Halocynthiibacter namhaensis]